MSATALLLATRSEGKLRELKPMFATAGLTLVSLQELEIDESEEENDLESYPTFEENALSKARYFYEVSGGIPTVADDSGLEVFALGGAPGVRSRRWAGATGTPDEVDAANNAELVRRLAGAPPERRRARYRCVLVLLRGPGSVPESFEGSCVGRILEHPVGTGGFGYDPYFFSDELQKSFGEAAPEEKDRVSHRGRALLSLAAELEQRPITA
jgi:XTP/dITP diphosphohydrolase